MAMAGILMVASDALRKQNGKTRPCLGVKLAEVCTFAGRQEELASQNEILRDFVRTQQHSKEQQQQQQQEKPTKVRISCQYTLVNDHA